MTEARPTPASHTMPASSTPPAPLSGRTRSIITVLVLSAFVVILNETILSVALVRLMEDLQVDEPTVQWVSTAFLLTMAVIIPTTGYLVQRFSTRTLYLTAMATFIVGTVICAAAPGIELLLVGRVIQAGGTAVMMPLLMTTILQLVPIQQRGRVMGMVMIVISVAPALGPTVSGLILQFLPWRAIFLIVLPVAIGFTIFGGMRLVNASEPVTSKLDIVSIPFTVLGFGGLVYALNSLGEGAGSPVLWVSLAVGLIGIALFVARQLQQQRVGSPMLDLRVLTHQPFRVGLGIIMIGFAALIGVAILWPIYLQDVHGLNAITTGLLLLPGGLMMGLLGPRIGRLYDKVGARVLAIPASIAMVAVIFAMSRVTATTPEAVLLALHVCLSLSLAFMFTPVFTAALNSLPPPLYSHGSATLGALQQVAGAAGTALLVAVMAATAAAARSGGVDDVAATQTGISTAFMVATGIGAVAVVLALMLRSGPPTAHEPEPAEQPETADQLR